MRKFILNTNLNNSFKLNNFYEASNFVSEMLLDDLFTFSNLIFTITVWDVNGILLSLFHISEWNFGEFKLLPHSYSDYGRAKIDLWHKSDSVINFFKMLPWLTALAVIFIWDFIC